MRRVLAAAILFSAALACGKKREAGPAPSGKPSDDKGAASKTSEATGATVAAPPIEPPTEAECDKAIANMTTFMKDEVPGDADDKTHCLGMPRPVVLCLQTAKTVDEVDRCVDRFAAQAAPTPEAHASEADCRAAMDNVRKLVPEMEGDPAQLVKDCTAMAGAGEVKCLRDAKSKEDLDKCDGVSD